MIGHSYGTFLTLDYMREHPEAIRAVALDGLVPPDVGFGMLWQGVGEGFDGIVEACEAQRDCREAYPDLRGTFNQLVREAVSDPVTRR